MEITANVSLKNGSRIGDKNIDKIWALADKPCEGIYEAGVKVENHRLHYKAKKEPEGYIFRHTRFNLGINGHHQSLRELILSTCIGHPHIKVHIDE